MKSPALQVHLNFPDLVTTEAYARTCRQRIIAACEQRIGNDLLKAVDPRTLASAGSGPTTAGSSTRDAAPASPPSGQPGSSSDTATGAASGSGWVRISLSKGGKPKKKGGAPPAPDAVAPAAADGEAQPAEADGGSGSSSASGTSAAAATPANADASAAAGAPAVPAAYLDWQKIIDEPHGSLRMLGSAKPPHLAANDPPWVQQSAYAVARFDRAAGIWASLPTTADLVSLCSIHPTVKQMRQFEASPAFLEAIYYEREMRRAKLAERHARLVQKQAREGGGADDPDSERDGVPGDYHDHDLQAAADALWCDEAAESYADAERTPNYSIGVAGEGMDAEIAR